MSKLPFRLKKIAELVSEKNICDVGCDHGKLAYYLLSNNKVDNVIVSDISRPSLQKAIDLLNSKGFKFEAICCDGLKGYEGKIVDQCIISGMGGNEIINIINSSPIEINSFILSPQHNNIEVKKFMLNRSYYIDYDIIISDKNKFYNIFRCIKSSKASKFDEFKLIIGDANFTDASSDAGAFVKNEIEKTDRILNGNNVDNQELINYLNLLKQYNERK